MYARDTARVQDSAHRRLPASRSPVIFRHPSARGSDLCFSRETIYIYAEFLSMDHCYNSTLAPLGKRIADKTLSSLIFTFFGAYRGSNSTRIKQKINPTHAKSNSSQTRVLRDVAVPSQPLIIEREKKVLCEGFYLL